MLIRPAQPEDFPAVAALTNVFIRETAIHFGYDPVTADDLHKAWAGHRDRYPWLVAELEGRFAGYAKAGPWRERAAYQWTPESGIYVEPWTQRRGVGRALYVRLFEVLRAQGYHSLVAGITLPNEPSVRLHEAVGFVPAGVIARAGWKFGRWHDVGFWQKPLAPEGHTPGPIAPPRG
ncbi:MAG: N-acetyltransferase family protein [Phycisphaerales bacterium]|nr:N-acetyltransferase family protein [Phycisphaerales bacterium]